MMKKILTGLLLLWAGLINAQTTPVLPGGYLPFSTQIYRKVVGTDTSYVTGASGKGFTVIPDFKTVKLLQDSLRAAGSNYINNNRTNIPENKRISVSDSILTTSGIKAKRINVGQPSLVDNGAEILSSSGPLVDPTGNIASRKVGIQSGVTVGFDQTDPGKYTVAGGVFSASTDNNVRDWMPTGGRVNVSGLTGAVLLLGKSGNIPQVAGVLSTVNGYVGANNTVSSARLFDGAFHVGSTVNSAIGIKLDNMNLSGVSSTGIYLTTSGNRPGPDPVGRWGLYDDTGSNQYLGTGNTLINTTTNNGIDKLQVNGSVSTTGLDNYTTDLSAGFTPLSKVSKAYVDARITAVDAIPTSGSNNTVSSNGMFNSLALKSGLADDNTFTGANTFKSPNVVFTNAAGGGIKAAIKTTDTNGSLSLYRTISGSTFNLSPSNTGPAVIDVLTPTSSGTLITNTDLNTVLNNYLPLTGGSLTGMLNGTNATFSNQLKAGNANLGSVMLTNMQLNNAVTGGPGLGFSSSGSTGAGGKTSGQIAFFSSSNDGSGTVGTTLGASQTGTGALTLPTGIGTLALTSDLTSKANLTGGNNFTGNNNFSNLSIYSNSVEYVNLNRQISGTNYTAGAITLGKTLPDGTGTRYSGLLTLPEDFVGNSAYFYLPSTAGKLALASDLTSKANLTGGNTYTGDQNVTGGGGFIGQAFTVHDGVNQLGSFGKGTINGTQKAGFLSSYIMNLDGTNLRSISLAPLATLNQSISLNWPLSSGIIATSNDLPLSAPFSKAGTAATTFTVTIGGPAQANTSYKVNVTPTNALSAAPFYITNKTTTTFDVVYTTAITGTVSFDWSLSK